MAAELTLDTLTGALIGLVRAADGSSYGLTTEETDRLIIAGLTAGEQSDSLAELLRRVESEKARLAPNCATCTASCGRTANYDMALLSSAPDTLREQKLRVLAAAREIAHTLASAPLRRDRCLILYKALFTIGDCWSSERLESLLAEMDVPDTLR